MAITCHLQAIDLWSGMQPNNMLVILLISGHLATTGPVGGRGGSHETGDLACGVQRDATMELQDAGRDQGLLLRGSSRTTAGAEAEGACA